VRHQPQAKAAELEVIVNLLDEDGDLAMGGVSYLATKGFERQDAKNAKVGRAAHRLKYATQRYPLLCPGRAAVESDRGAIIPAWEKEAEEQMKQGN
jgi:hypothetical protein